MKLSVIIPVYNAEKYLCKCVESIMVCPSEELEVILVNDGSRDSSLQLCRKFEQKDNRIHVISKENAGVSVARNRGIQVASGEYIMFIDADDYMDTEKWNLILQYTQQDWDFVAFAYESLYADESVKPEFFSAQQNLENLKDAYRILLTTPLLHTCWGKLFRREIIQKRNICFPKGVKIGEDYLFVLEYFRYVTSAVFVNETVLFYRQNEAGAMGSFEYQERLKNVKSIWMYCQKYAEDLKVVDLKSQTNYYQFCSFTYFLRTIAKKCGSIKECRALYKKTLVDSDICRLLESVPKDKLERNKKIEFALVNSHRIWLLAAYFTLKYQMVK